MFYIYNIKKKAPVFFGARGDMESWQSGLSRLFAKQVNQKVTGVRIPCFPQSCINERTTLGYLRLLWERPIYKRE